MDSQYKTLFLLSHEIKTDKMTGRILFEHSNNDYEYGIIRYYDNGQPQYHALFRKLVHKFRIDADTFDNQDYALNWCIIHWTKFSKIK